MKKFIALFLALILCALLCACNGNSSDTNSATGSQSTSTDTGVTYETGTEVGNKLPSFAVETFDQTGVLGTFVDPTETGKVTVVNFWGTWCHFCLEELPYFSEAASTYSGEVEFIAIHTKQDFKKTAAKYVGEKYADSQITFAVDVNTDGGLDDAYTAFGGEAYYPYTLILNENGVITYKAAGQIPESLLIYEIEKALGK